MVRESDADRRNALARELARIDLRRTFASVHQYMHENQRPRRARTQRTTRLVSTDDPRPAAYLIRQCQPMNDEEWRTLERQITIHYVANVACETLETLFSDATNDTYDN